MIIKTKLFLLYLSNFQIYLLLMINYLLIQLIIITKTKAITLNIIINPLKLIIKKYIIFCI